MHVRRALASALAVPLLLAGCSEDPEPEPKMPDPTSSSPSPSPAATETAEAESPEDFIRRWVTVTDEMQASGDVREFKKLSKNCQACSGVAEQVQSIYSSGGSIDFAGSEISQLKQIAPKPPTFNLDLKTPETVIRRSDGSVDQRLPAGTGQYRVTLNGKPGEWFVAAYARR